MWQQCARSWWCCRLSCSLRGAHTNRWAHGDASRVCFPPEARSPGWWMDQPRWQDHPLHCWWWQCGGVAVLVWRCGGVALAGGDCDHVHLWVIVERGLEGDQDSAQVVCLLCKLLVPDVPNVIEEPLT